MSFCARAAGRGADPQGDTHLSGCRPVHGRGPYKESLWFTVEQPAEQWTSRPAFWFELMPEGWSYGMGYWMPKPVTMAKLRARIDRDPRTMERLTRALGRQREFTLDAENYRRPKSAAPSKLLERGTR